MAKQEVTITVTVKPPLDHIESFHVSFDTALEMLHIMCMGKWELKAPHPGKLGMLGTEIVENSQQARLQYLLEGIGTVNPERAYSTLATRTVGSRITTEQPEHSLPLRGRWYLNCCLNLDQKLEIVDALRYLGYSPAFIETARQFVAGRQRQNALEIMERPLYGKCATVRMAESDGRQLRPITDLR